LSKNKKCKDCKYPMKKRCWHPFGKKSKGRRMLYCVFCGEVDYE